MQIHFFRPNLGYADVVGIDIEYGVMIVPVVYESRVMHFRGGT